MASGLLTCSKNVCCVFVVFVNIIAMMVSTVLLILGILLLWGYQIVSALYPSALTQVDSIGAQLSSSLGVDIDIRSQLANLAQVTATAGAAILVLAAVVMTTACVGCWAACCERRKLLAVYVALVIAIFAVQNVALLVWFTNSSVVKESARGAMQSSLAVYTGIDSSNLQSLLQNMVQLFVGCCGVTNGTDFYTLSPYWKRQYTMRTSSYNLTYNMTYPITCCKFNMSSFKPLDEYCSYNNTNTDNNWYQTGCYDKLIRMIESLMNLKAMVIAIVSILIFQLLLVLGAAIILTARRATKVAKVAPS